MSAKVVLRAGVLGAGWAAERYVAAMADAGVDLAWICSRTEPRARRLADGYGFPRATTSSSDEGMEHSDVDFVVICSPNNLHAAQSLRYASAGLGILVEKPVATEMADIERVAQVVWSRGVPSAVGFVQRAGRYQQEIKGLVLSGSLGSITFADIGYVTYQSHDRFLERSWMQRASETGDTFLLSGIHAFDTARWLVSTEVSDATFVEVSAVTRHTRSEVDYPDFGAALVRFDNGATAVVTSHLSSRGDRYPPVTLFGTDGTIRGDEVWSREREGESGWRKLAAPHPMDEGHYKLYQRHLSLFADTVRGLASMPSIPDSVNTHEACIAAGRAAREGITIRLPAAEG